MDNAILLNFFIERWNFVRGETLEILHSLNDEQLLFTPKNNKFAPIYWEFNCIGRTQIVYTKAVKTGVMDFSYFHSEKLPTKHDFKTNVEISNFLQKTDDVWLKTLKEKGVNDGYMVKWFGKDKPLVYHISSLAEHERLHHGQFISYFTLAGFSLPKNFKKNWNL